MPLNRAFQSSNILAISLRAYGVHRKKSLPPSVYCDLLGQVPDIYCKYIDYSHMRLLARSVSTCDKRRHLAYNRIESLEGAPIGCRRRICNRSWSQLDVWKCWEKPWKAPNHNLMDSWFLSWSSFSISFHHFPLFNGHKLGRTPLVTQIRPAEAWWIFGAAVTSWIAWIWGGCHQISPDLHN